MADVANFAARNFGFGPDLAQIDLARSRNALAQQELQMGPMRQQYMQQQIDTGQANENRITQQNAAQDQAQKIQWLHGASVYALQHPEAWGYVVDEGKKRGILPPDFNPPHDPQKLQDFVNQIEVMQGGGPAQYGAPEQGPGGSLLQRDPSGKMTAVLPREPTLGDNSTTGSLQEVNAINAYRQKQNLPPISPEEYLRNKRGTSADIQSYNQYLGTLQPGTQPMSMPDYLGAAAGTKAGAEKQAQTLQERFGKQIDEGYKAADSLPVLNRSIELLDIVKTGGLAAAQLAATNFLGVTGADEGQLSANVGKAVLAQLRTTFGAQFTEAEGRRLGDIEAGFGKSTAVNRRLLGQAKVLVERVANRGIYAAEQTNSKYDAEQIRKGMTLKLDANAGQGQSEGYQEGQTATNPQTGEKLIFKGGQWVPNAQ